MHTSVCLYKHRKSSGRKRLLTVDAGIGIDKGSFHVGVLLKLHGFTFKLNKRNEREKRNSKLLMVTRHQGQTQGQQVQIGHDNGSKRVRKVKANKRQESGRWAHSRPGHGRAVGKGRDISDQTRKGPVDALTSRLPPTGLICVREALAVRKSCLQVQCDVGGGRNSRAQGFIRQPKPSGFP